MGLLAFLVRFEGFRNGWPCIEWGLFEAHRCGVRGTLLRGGFSMFFSGFGVEWFRLCGWEFVLEGVDLVSASCDRF